MKPSQMRDVLTHHARGLSIDDNVTLSRISRKKVIACIDYFGSLIEHIENIEAYEQLRVPVLSMTEMGIVKSMCDPEKLKGATMSQLSMALREVSKLRRLESGQSTSNAAHKHSLADIGAARN